MSFRAPGRAIFALGVVIFVASSALAVMRDSVKLPAEPPAGALNLLGRPDFREQPPPTPPFNRRGGMTGSAFNGSGGNSGLPEGWQIAQYDKSGAWAIAVGAPWDVGVKASEDADYASAALDLAGKFAVELGMTDATFSVETINRPKKMTVVAVRPEYDGARVYGSLAVFTFNQDGKLISCKATGFGSVRQGSFKIGVKSATEQALSAFEAEDKLSVKSVEPRWLPEIGANGTTLRAVYEATLTSANAELRPAVFVDAETGAIAAAENRVVYDDLSGDTRGNVHPNYARDDEEEQDYPFEWVSLRGGAQIFSDDEGNFTFNVNAGATPFRLNSELRGRWVDVNYEDGPDANLEIRIERIQNVSFFWNEENSRPDERMLFVHVNGIHEYFKWVDPNFDGMDWALPATCGHGDNYDNAFWNGEGIYFGEGAQMDNFALYTDIIQHEYTHGVTSQIYRWDQLPYTGESGALNEAWSDYFPCSKSNEPYMGEGGLVDMGGFIRLIDNDLVYPRDWFGEVHYDSRMISAAMWHSREVLGKEVTDPLFHTAKYQLGNNFLSYFVDVMETDDDDGDVSNGTPHDNVLYEQFGRHGIGPGLRPKLVIQPQLIEDDDERGASGDENYQFEPGETIRIEVNVERLGVLFPPPAEDVQVRMTTENPHVELVRDVARYGDLHAGERVANQEPFLIRVRDDAALSFATLYLTASAVGEPNLARDTIRIPIGRTQVLVVQDGRDRIDRMDWYRTALDQNEVVYSEYEMYSTPLNFAWRLAQFRTVIWFTGDTKSEFLDRDNLTLIRQFMDRGGNLLLTGQYIGREIDAAFLEDYFGCRVLQDSITQYIMEGVEGDPVGRGMNILLLGAGGAMNQRHPATVEATNGVEIFHYPRLPNRPAGGVRYEIPSTGAKTIFLGFGLEGVSGHGGTNTRADVIDAAMQWFGEPTGVKKDSGLRISDFGLDGAYPNPFNSTTTIRYTLPVAGEASLRIFDLSGREVATLVEKRAQQSPPSRGGPYAVTWDAGNMPAGVYVVRLEGAGKAEAKKVVLVR